MSLPDKDDDPAGSLSDHEKNAWDAIVADLSGQVDLGPAFRAAPAPEVQAQPDDSTDDLPAAYAWLDEGYEPPEPPAMPRPRDTIERASWAGAIGGPAVIVTGWVLGWEGWLIGLGVAASVAGFIGLIARMPGDRDPDDDDGAVV